MILIFARRPTLKKIKALMFCIGLLDAFLMAMLAFLTSGFDSTLYLVFVALILHNALVIPLALPQLLLNLFVCAAFMAGGWLDQSLIAPGDLMAGSRVESPVERMTVLVARAVCCYGVQVLFEKQKLAERHSSKMTQ